MKTYTGEWQSSPVKTYACNLPVDKGDVQKQVSHMLLKNDCRLTWHADIPESGRYAVTVSYSANEEGTVSFEIDGHHAFSQTLAETRGLVYPTVGEWHQINCVRKKTGGELVLEKGAQDIIIHLSPDKDDMNFLLYTFELIPVDALDKAAAETARIAAQRPDATWFTSIPYGVMFHWTSESSPSTGNPLPFAEAVRNFDVKKFADMVQQTGAGYVIFTVGHAESFCPAPIQSWEKYHPGTVTGRDLIDEIADELAKREIRLMIYFASHVFAKTHQVSGDEFMRISTDILNEIGERYGDKVSGYWFDGWYQSMEAYPDLPIEKFYRATKTGNPNRIAALNTWVYPAFTQWQDFWAGETYSDCVAPVSAIIDEGPGAGLLFQALLALEGDWVYARSQYPDNKPIPAPKLDVRRATDAVISCAGKGPVTFNLMIRQDGTVGEQSMQFMEQLKRGVQSVR
jgi:hypothetical protein